MSHPVLKLFEAKTLAQIFYTAQRDYILYEEKDT